VGGKVEVTRRARLTGGLLRETCLSTSGPRRTLAILLAVGVLSTALPASAAVFTVWNEATLSRAIKNAHNGDYIAFEQNITLSANLPTVQRDVTIVGNNFTLSGNNQHRGLFVQSGTVAINDLTIANAKALGGKGGNGTVDVALDWGGGGGGGAGLGGALFVASGANVTVSNVRLQANLARGGNGGETNRSFGIVGASGGGGGYWPTGADGGKANPFASGGGGAPRGAGGDGGIDNGRPGGFGGGGGGGGSGTAGSGGFGGGGGGIGTGGTGGCCKDGSGSGNGGSTVAAPGGFGGGNSDSNDRNAGGGGGAGLGGAIFVQEGGHLTLAGSLDISRNTVAGGSGGGRAQPGQGIGPGLFLHGDGSFSVAPGSGQTQTISDAIVDQTGVGGRGDNGGSWSLVKNGAGTTILTGANAYSGGTFVNAGMLQGNTSSLRDNIINNATVVFDQAGNGTYDGNMFGTGNLFKRGDGEVALTGDNTYTGGTRVEQGTLLVASDAKLGKADGHLHLLSGGGLHASGTFTSARPVGLLNGDGVVLVDAGKALTLSGVIEGGGTLVKSGFGDLILSGANTYSGGTRVEGGGVLRFTTDDSLGAAGGGITLNGGSIGTTSNTPAATSFSRGISLAGIGGIDVAQHPITWSGNIGGDGQLIKSGAGELALTGANTYTGGTLVAAGTLQVASDDKLGAADASIWLENNGALRASETFTSTRNVSLHGAGGVFLVDVNKALTLSGIVSGANVTKAGDGTLILIGANSYAGNMFINGGTVQGNTTSLQGSILNNAALVFDQSFDGTFGGNIAGLGTLTKTGAGTLILSGNNKYSAGTTVSAGTLQGNTTSLQGNIVNNAGLIFDQGFDGAYANAMTGSGTLTKNGTGKLTLTANNTVGGGTTLNEGGLAVNGILTSNVTMNGGILSGAGNIVGDITQNGGEIAPGNSIGNFTIDGNFTVDRGILEFEVNPNGTSDRITVTGAGHKATLNGGTVEVIALPGAYTPNTEYTIVATSGGVVGTFDNVTEDFAFLTPTLSYDPNNVYLALELAPNAFAAAGQMPNQQAVGAVHDAIAADGKFGGIVGALSGLQTAHGALALHALSGEVHASAAGVLLDDSRYVREAASERVRAAFEAVGAPSVPVMAYDKGEIVPAAAATDRFAVWGEAFGATGSIDRDGNAADLDRSTGGFLAGADAGFGSWRLGLLAGYSHTSFDVDQRASSGSSDNLHLGLYGGSQWGQLGVRAGAAYTWHDIDTTRQVAFPGFSETLSGEYDAGTAQAFGELGYRITAGRAAFEPFANLAYVELRSDAFTETGGTAALTSAKTTTDATFTTLGVRAATDFDIGKARATARGMLGWRHAFGDVTPRSSLAFAGSDAFTIAGAPIAKDALALEAGLDFALTPFTTLGVSYSGQIANNTQDHAFKAKFTITF
jgi:outer membrane autotransporter protein